MAEPTDIPEADALKTAVAGLTYPSESDSPFDVFTWVDALRLAQSAKEVLAHHIPADRKVEDVPLDRFFTRLETTNDLTRVRALRQTVETNLRDIAIFRGGVGEVEVDVYLLGRTQDGKWVGLHSVSVET